MYPSQVLSFVTKGWGTEQLLLAEASNSLTCSNISFHNLADSAMWEDAGVMEGTTMTLEDFRDQIVRHEGLAEGLAQR